jgi:hypothetical protein
MVAGDGGVFLRELVNRAAASFEAGIAPPAAASSRSGSL